MKKKLVTNENKISNAYKIIVTKRKQSHTHILCNTFEFIKMVDFIEILFSKKNSSFIYLFFFLVHATEEI